MFVPSLSWQNDRFLIYKWLKNAVSRRPRRQDLHGCGERQDKTPVSFGWNDGNQGGLPRQARDKLADEKKRLTKRGVFFLLSLSAGTDMSKHFDVLTKFKLRVDAEQFDLGNQEDRTMLCCAVRFDSLIPWNHLRAPTSGQDKTRQLPVCCVFRLPLPYPYCVVLCLVVCVSGHAGGACGRPRQRGAPVPHGRQVGRTPRRGAVVRPPQ
eukprot:COSAG06_NODE_5641_length_3344_cov_22.891834_2_plen_209_part_00